MSDRSSQPRAASWARAALATLLVGLAGSQVAAQTDSLGTASTSMAAVAGAPDLTRLLPADVRIEDLPNDNGTGLVVRWTAPDAATVPEAASYRVAIGTSPDGPFYPAKEVSARYGPRASDAPLVFGRGRELKSEQYAVVGAYTVPPEMPGGPSERATLVPGTTYYAQFSATDNGTEATLANALTAVPRQNLFRWNKSNHFIFVIFLGAVILIFIEMAKRNPNMYIRKIAGLDAVEEALGRATEMGKPVYFIHGLESMGHISTIASVNILGRVARRTAQYDTTLKVTNNDPIVYAVSQEVVHQSCIEAGRPDAYAEDNVMFVAPNQFSYAAAVDGMMVRERPATVLLMGYFYAESLLFTETGDHIGAIQIAGTDAYTQLPFFITTCDYTLMGEELYAASAYLSREPKLLGSLRGQDVGKAVLLAALAFGTILEMFGIHWFTHLVMPL